MQIRLIFYIIPVFIFTVSKIPFMPFAKGWTPGPISLIVKGSSEDVIIHEMQHSKQFYKLPFVFWLAYLVPVFRLHFEAEAYAAQAKYIMLHNVNAIEDKVISDLSIYLNHDYKLNYTLADMKSIILYYYNK